MAPQTLDIWELTHMPNSPVIYRGNNAFNLKDNIQSQTFEALASSNQILLNGTGGGSTTISANFSTARTVTFPDIGADYNLVPASGNTAIAGTKTFTSPVYCTTATAGFYANSSGAAGQAFFRMQNTTQSWSWIMNSDTTNGVTLYDWTNTTSRYKFGLDGVFDIFATSNQLRFGTTNTTTISATAPSSSLTLTIPDAGTNANFVLSESAQTIAGALTLSSALTITPTTNQLVLGTTNTTTISATAPSSSLVYTMPDVGGNADFVMTAGAQTIGGAKTFSSPVSISDSTTNAALNITSQSTIVNNNDLFGAINFVSSDASAGASGTRVKVTGQASDSAGGIGAGAFVVQVTDASTTTLTEVFRAQSTGSGNFESYFLNGNVGIGTASPTAKLHVSEDSANAYINLTRTGTTPHRLLLGAENSGCKLYARTTGTTAGPMAFLSGTTQAIAYDTAGAVTLGPSGAALRHNVNGEIRATYNINAAPAIEILNTNSGTSSAARMLLTSNGGTGVIVKNSTTNTAAPGADRLGVINESGGVYLAPGGTSWTAISDMRHKTKISDLGQVLQGLLGLSVFTYQTDESVAAGKAPIELGLSAQEMLNVAPEVVTGSEETQYGISYDRLSVVAIKAIQELASLRSSDADRIEKLTAKLEAAEAEIEALKGASHAL